MVKRYLAVFASLLVFVFAGAPYAAEKNVDQWLKSMGSRINAVSKGKKHKASSVAGVKGAEERLEEDLYWKKESVTDAEADDFKNALAVAGGGDRAKGAEAMEDFIKKYPSSPLAKDAGEGLFLLKGSAEAQRPGAEEEGPRGAVEARPEAAPGAVEKQGAEAKEAPVEKVEKVEKPAVERPDVKQGEKPEEKPAPEAKQAQVEDKSVQEAPVKKPKARAKKPKKPEAKPIKPEAKPQKPAGKAEKPAVKTLKTR